MISCDIHLTDEAYRLAIDRRSLNCWKEIPAIDFKIDLGIPMLLLDPCAAKASPNKKQQIEYALIG